jgi:hypothetical protein
MKSNSGEQKIQIEGFGTVAFTDNAMNRGLRTDAQERRQVPLRDRPVSLTA